MSLTELYNYLLGKAEIPLTQSGLGEGGITLFPLLPELSDAEITLVLSLAPTWEDATQTKFRIEGTSKQPLLGMDASIIQLIAELDGNTIQFQMQIKTISNWTFGTSFPKLQNTEFNWLLFSPTPRFILITQDIPSEGLVQGLNFKGNLQVTNSIAALLELIPEADNPLPVVGTIAQDDSYQNIAIKAQVTNSTPSLNLPGLLTFQFPTPKIALYAYIHRGNQSVALFKRIESNVSLSDRSGTTVTIPLALELPSLVTGWQIMLQPGKEVSLTNFWEFLSLLGSAGQLDLIDLFSDPTGKLNAVQTILQTLFLKSFYVEISGSLNATPQFKSFSFDVQSEGTLWEIIEHKLALTNLRVFLKVAKEGTAYSKLGFIQGEVEIAQDIAINSIIPLPIGNGNWQFSSSHPVALANIDLLSQFIDNNSIGQLLPASLEDVGGLVLARLHLVYDPSQRGISQIEFEISTSHSWIILQDEFEISSLYLYFTIQKIGTDWVLLGTIRGELWAGGITIDTLIQKSVPDSDWYFNLHANSVALPSLADLSRLTGGEEALSSVLPDSLLTAQLYFDNPRIEFDISQRKLEFFGFSLATDEIDFDQFKIIRAGVDVDISFSTQSTEKNVKIYGLFSIANVDIFVGSESSSTGGWELQGMVGLEQPILIGELVTDLANKFPTQNEHIVLPAPIQSLSLKNLETSFNTLSKDFTFTCNCDFSVENIKVDTTITINLEHQQQDGSFKKTFGGHIAVDVPIRDVIQTLLFNLKFLQEQASSEFIAIYSHPKDQPLPTIKNLVNAFSPRTADYIPQNVTVDLRDVIFAYDKAGEIKLYLFGVDLDISIDLSDLPLIGKLLPYEERLGVNPLQIIISSKEILQAQVAAFNALVPSGVNKLPDRTLQNGLNIAGVLQLGSLSQPLILPVADPTTTAPPAQAQLLTSTSAATNDNTLWYKVQRAFGPIHLERIGLQYQHPSGEAAVIAFLLDASLSASGLTLSLEGLSISVSLEQIPSLPRFNLRGLGVDYKNGPIEIGGAFLQGKIPFQGKEYDDYSGTAIIRTEALTLAAIGSYVQLDVGPSMFVYAVLDKPIGGPAFFFVTGLAAGFGYNRLLHVPPVEQIDTFPLVQEAMGKLTGTPNLADELAKLQPYIPPSVGNYFLAIGIRFTSFKMIDSFILVSATFGDRFELDVVGLSTLVLPVPEVGKEVTPIAEVQLALRASFIPDDGFFGINAQLTNNSFLLDRQCHLTGGFAFYTWFTGEHEGDFVLTVGGYHPNFSVPSHYPTVPRLSFNWQVNDQLTFKGSAYYALTPSALMAGCSLSATWQDGDLEAWFDAGLDFLITWKPYHYEADFHISVGASYTFWLFGTHHISASVGADVSIWGPDFAGTAHISWYIISFTISFGASGRNQLNPILWDEFRSSFLPKDNQICTINLKAGLIERQGAKDSKDTQQKDSNDLGIVNPKTLCLTTDSVIPMQRAYGGTQNPTELPHNGATTAFNIGTMQIFNDQIISTQHIIITHDGKSAETKFEFQPLTKNAPTALWGPRLKPSLQGEQVISNLLTGYEIRAKRPTEAPDPARIDYATLQQAATLENVNDAFQWAQLIPFVAQTYNDQEARKEINNKITSTLNKNDVASKRAAIANALFDDIALDLNGLKAEDFLSVPQVKELTPA
jgi:hypothetical protein